jgi:hypothetical protein
MTDEAEKAEGEQIVIECDENGRGIATMESRRLEESWAEHDSIVS